MTIRSGGYLVGHLLAKGDHDWCLACNEVVLRGCQPAWGSPEMAGDAPDPSSTWHGADATGALWRPSAQLLSPCSMSLAHTRTYASKVLNTRDNSVV